MKIEYNKLSDAAGHIEVRAEKDGKYWRVVLTPNYKGRTKFTPFGIETDIPKEIKDKMNWTSKQVTDYNKNG